MDPPEIGVHAPPLQETVANEEELEDPSAPQRSNGPENGVKEKSLPKFEAFEAESPNQEDPIIPDALPCSFMSAMFQTLLSLVYL